MMLGCGSSYSDKYVSTVKFVVICQKSDRVSDSFTVLHITPALVD